MNRFYCLLLTGVATCAGLGSSPAAAFEPQLAERHALPRTAVAVPAGYRAGVAFGAGMQVAPAPAYGAGYGAPAFGAPGYGFPGAVAPCPGGFCGTPVPQPMGCQQYVGCTCASCAGASCAPTGAGIWAGPCGTQGCVVLAPVQRPMPAPRYPQQYQTPGYGQPGTYGLGLGRLFPFLQ